MAATRAVAYGWLLEQLLVICANLCLFALTVSQRLEISERQLHVSLQSSLQRLYGNVGAGSSVAAGLHALAGVPAPSPSPQAASGRRGPTDRRPSFTNMSSSAQVLRTLTGDGTERQSITVPRVKITLNLATIAISALLLAVSVDPYGAMGIYTVTARAVLFHPVTVIQICVVAFVFYSNVRLSLSIMRLPPPTANARVLGGLMAVIVFVTLATLVARIWTLDAFWTYGVYLAVVLIGVLALLCEVQYGVRVLRAAAQRFESSASAEVRVRLPVLAEALSKLKTTRNFVVLITVAVVPLQLLGVLATLRTDEDAHRYRSVDYTKYSLSSSTVFLWATYGITLFMVWYAWVPPLHLGQQHVEPSEDSASRSTDSSLGDPPRPSPR